ncbi:hypothetical protein MNBD_GAMMA13-936 [hydrothermal vent metagenome]|uniref:General secretion pathway GspH domain-containing protein n=1 Tax=hydrothermal vent metagenome TaxID=652676 RepID=A0A3B0Z511_9ZZZZ
MTLSPVWVLSNSQTRLPKITTGFTLIELVAVIVIVATLSLFALPNSGHNDTTIPAHADKFGRVLRHAQALAMSQGRTLVVDIQSTTRYSITDGATSIPIRDLSGNEQLFFFSDGVTLAGKDIAFDSLGRPIDGGNLITKAQAWVLSGTSNTARVSIQPLTGFIAVAL